VLTAACELDLLAKRLERQIVLRRNGTESVDKVLLQLSNGRSEADAVVNNSSNNFRLIDQYPAPALG
jgi:hypothetical protein